MFSHNWPQKLVGIWEWSADPNFSVVGVRLVWVVSIDMRREQIAARKTPAGVYCSILKVSLAAKI